MALVNEFAFQLEFYSKLSAHFFFKDAWASVAVGRLGLIIWNRAFSWIKTYRYTKRTAPTSEIEKRHPKDAIADPHPLRHRSS